MLRTKLQVGLALTAAIVILACASALAAPPAQPGKVNVTVTASTLVGVFYTGNHQLIFNITADDIKKEEKILIDQGDVLWFYNDTPWVIRVSRGPWSKDGDPGWPPSDKVDNDVKLSIRQDTKPPKKIHVPTGWWEVPRTVDNEKKHWAKGDVGGQGTFHGVDWRAHFPKDKLTPGTYRTTVTFTISIEH